MKEGELEEQMRAQMKLSKDGIQKEGAKRSYTWKVLQNRSVDAEEHDIRMYTFMLTNPKVIFF